MIRLRYSILINLLLFLLQPLSSAQMESAVASTPNIVLGKVFNKGQTYLLLEITWQLKGDLKTNVIELALDESVDNPIQYKNGDQVLVFLSRNRVHPMSETPLVGMMPSRFDELEGQSAYMKVSSDKDYATLSEIYSKIHDKEMAAVFSF
ncbi:MAG: hypothetical protein A2293_12215 [Elusimicrobia bacterium RIFOXYB2_FULL_49_7]|nr:MAG: hypothetical protein A2293_12215 [Elusimicrobia bacterium RIFOXYB2_FULL_49_7]